MYLKSDGSCKVWPGAQLNVATVSTRHAPLLQGVLVWACVMETPPFAGAFGTGKQGLESCEDTWRGAHELRGCRCIQGPAYDMTQKTARALTLHSNSNSVKMVGVIAKGLLLSLTPQPILLLPLPRGVWHDTSSGCCRFLEMPTSGEYALISARDPGLQVRTAEVWRGQGLVAQSLTLGL